MQSRITQYHAKYFAHELTKRDLGDNPDRLSRALFDARVDLNPHQIDAALFALRSPLGGGVLLADEVGLGKTIEAGLVLCQLWAEGQRKLLVVVPASLRKQWAVELEDKFGLPVRVLDGSTVRAAELEGESNPFDTSRVVVASIHFVAAKAELVRSVKWHLCVIDEAHKLRNCYRESNTMGQRVRFALSDTRKILLTATPLQNSLLELYGLSTLLDPYMFGDLPAFRMLYMNQDADLADLRDRLRVFCTRTLRKDVHEHVKYTARKARTFKFDPSPEEHDLYERVSDLLTREDSYAVPHQQKHLTALVVRKLLASSSRAVAGTLDALRKRLENILRETPKGGAVERLFAGEDLDDEYLDTLLEEYAEDEGEREETPGESSPGAAAKPNDRRRVMSEIDELRRLADIARGIGVDEKARQLLKALETGFAAMQEQGARRRALIFTESRRTQRYLRDWLESNGYAGKVITFSGGSVEESRAIYNQWKAENPDAATGSRAVDTRQAIVDHFDKHAEIMIATEAGAEGVNLQFCSMVINYDLPWNPQRIEQRIGRCHRYGQKHDVVVMNFLNSRNHADARVYDLLDRKLQLFNGIFGSSDEVLGQLQSGVDFERRVLDIYQTCRTAAQIDAAFDALQAQMEASIRARMAETRQKLLEHFDQDVHERLRVRLEGARATLKRFGRRLWALSKWGLDSRAEFDEDTCSFRLADPPGPSIDAGRYAIVDRDIPQADIDPSGPRPLRLSSPLGEYLISQGHAAATPYCEVVFDSSRHPGVGRHSPVEQLRGRSGWLILQSLRVEALEAEERLLFSGFFDEDGKPGEDLPADTADRLFEYPAIESSARAPSTPVADRLTAEAERRRAAALHEAMEHSNLLFREEAARLERWEEDMVAALERQIDALKARKRAAERAGQLAPTLAEQAAAMAEVQKITAELQKLRASQAEQEAAISAQRFALIEAVRARMDQKSSHEVLFTIRWAVK